LQGAALFDLLWLHGRMMNRLPKKVNRK
jgi:hypothetical protein